jgi:hypothetical protein
MTPIHLAIRSARSTSTGTAAANEHLSPNHEAAMTQPTLRRDVMLAALVSSLPVGFLESAAASPLNPEQTMITPPGKLHWKATPAYGEPSRDLCNLAGDPDQPGLYYILMRWWPGFMSAPHHYTTDRLCVVVSGTWWCNSGPDFDPAACVPVTPGSFVRRVAGTPHYDGVIRGAHEPAVIAICGMGPVNYAIVDASKPAVRRV